MRKKYNKKYTSFTDRFPFIIVALIVVFAIILVFQFKAKFLLPFFSENVPVSQDTASTSYPILVASPTAEEVFNLISENEYAPIEIQSRQIEELNYNLKLVINDKDIVKTFRSPPPYRHDWHLANPGHLRPLF